MFGAKFADESLLIVDNYQISGVTSFDLSYSNETSIVKPLGYSAGAIVHNGDSKKNISIVRDLILTTTQDNGEGPYTDYFLQYTGLILSTGFLQYENKISKFTSGYLTDYSINYAIGSIPKVTTNFSVFGAIETGAIYNPILGKFDYGRPVSLTTAKFICDNSSTNRIVGVDYSVKINRKPIYTIGSDSPVSVELVPPLEYVATVQIEVDDAFMKNAKDFLTNKEKKNISFNLGKYANSEFTNIDDPILVLNVPKASLVSEQLSASAEGVLKLTLTYIGHS